MVRLLMLNKKILISGALVFGILISIYTLTNRQNHDKEGNIKGIVSELPQNMKILVEKQLPDGRFAVILGPEVFTGLGIALLDKNRNFINWLPESEYLGPNEGDKYPGQYVNLFGLEDFNNDGKVELAIEFITTGSGLSRPFYLYQYKNNSFELLIKLLDGKSNSNLSDLDNDGNKEILHSYVLDSTGWLGRNYTPWNEVWTWQDGKYQLANNLFPDVYKELMPVYEGLMNDAMKNDLAQPYQPVIKCLQENANLNIHGQLADGKECSRIIFDD
jgi:hypothetical protein